MKLTLLPLQKDDVMRARCEGPVSRREQDDPLQTLLGPHCYSHKVLLNLERAQGVDTSGISWLIQSHSRFRQAGGKLVLVAVPPVVTDVLQFLRLESQLCIAPHEDAACELVLEPTDNTSPKDGSGGSVVRFPR